MDSLCGWDSPSCCSLHEHPCFSSSSGVFRCCTLQQSLSEEFSVLPWSQARKPGSEGKGRISGPPQAAFVPLELGSSHNALLPPTPQPHPLVQGEVRATSSHQRREEKTTDFRITHVTDCTSGVRPSKSDKSSQGKQQIRRQRP